MFIRTEVLRIKWQSFTARHIINQKQPDREEVFKYLCILVSNDARCKCEIKSRIVMSKATFKKNKPKLQLLEEKTVMYYIWSITL